jgi:hypothetical protein
VDQRVHVVKVAFVVEASEVDRICRAREGARADEEKKTAKKYYGRGTRHQAAPQAVAARGGERPNAFAQGRGGVGAVITHVVSERWAPPGRMSTTICPYTIRKDINTDHDR